MSLSDSISQRSGNIEKAVIEIIDMRGREVVVEPAVEVQGGGLAGKSSFIKGVVVESPVEVQGGGLAGKLSSVPSMSSLKASEAIAGASALAGTKANAGKKAGNAAGATKKLFYVQFNPNEVTLTGHGGGLASQTDFSKRGSSIGFDKADVRITMNMKLIFDKTDPQDAFMGDKFNMSATSIATGTVKAVRSATGKKDNSVQAEVEGFIAALRSRYTRRITFYWGTMNYSGILNKVSAQYTMFNVLGLPIRAYVDLSLVCADEEVYPGSMGRWQKYYMQLFEAGDQSYVKAAQKAGNWFNFNV